MTLRLQLVSELSRVLVKTQMAGTPPPKSPWSLRICIFNKFPGEAGVTGLGPHFENRCLGYGSSTAFVVGTSLRMLLSPHWVPLMRPPTPPPPKENMVSRQREAELTVNN